ncbi:MAG: 2-dehydro-3-deoxygalactonokinase, partial [Desulfobacterales bacterium]|nr:2-dehydro-3-deoxygalactonokinase [Desulfobacterales bacterium]
LIGTMVHESIDMAAFTQSVERAISGDAGVLNPLFALRSDTICGRQSEDVVAAKLSGLLIGTEIAEATRRYGKPEKVILVGDSRLCSLYEAALHAADIEAVCCDDDVAAQGIFSIASNLLNPVGASC